MCCILSTVVSASHSYDFNDPSYIKEIESLGDNIYREEDIVKILNRYEKENVTGFDDGNGNVREYKGLEITRHIYAWKNNNALLVATESNNIFSRIKFEQESYYLSDETRYRYFSNATIYWNKFNTEQFNDYSVEELNDYLVKMGLNAHFEDYEIKYDSTELKDIIDIVIALDDKFQIGMPIIQIESSGRNYNIPVEKHGNTVLKGDADLDGEVGLSDVVAVTKYNLSNNIYPLANDTAYANADMNSDGVVDGLDASALIENQLGK